MHARTHESAGLMNNSNFRKGDIAYLVNYGTGSVGSGHVTFWARHVEITSMGKKQGTAILVGTDQKLFRRLYTNHAILRATVAEVEAYAAEVGPAVSAAKIRNEIKILESWMANTAARSRAQHGEKYVAEVEADLAKLRTAVPSYSITYPTTW